MLTLFLFGFGQHFKRGVFEIKYGAQLESHDLGLRFIKLQPNLVPKLLGVREKDSPLGSEDQQTAEDFVF
jgi:hypothetical protein